MAKALTGKLNIFAQLENEGPFKIQLSFQDEVIQGLLEVLWEACALLEIGLDGDVCMCVFNPRFLCLAAP